MGYIESHLVEGERLVYRGRRHPIFHVAEIARTAVIAGAGVAVLAVIGAASNGAEHVSLTILRTAPETAATAGNVVGLLVLLIGLALFALAAFFISGYFSEECAVTNRRVVIKRGLLRQRVLDIALRHVEAVSITQTIKGRLLCYGTVGVSGAGQSTAHYEKLLRPSRFREMIHHESQGAAVSAVT